MTNFLSFFISRGIPITAKINDNKRMGIRKYTQIVFLYSVTSKDQSKNTINTAKLNANDH